MRLFKTFAIWMLAIFILWVSAQQNKCLAANLDLGDSYVGLGLGVVVGETSNLTIPTTTTIGPLPPPGSTIIDLFNENFSPVNPVSFSADFHIGHWYKSIPWLGWRTIFNVFFEQKSISQYSYAQASPLLNGCGSGNCYFKNTSYTNKMYLMPSFGWDLISLRIPEKYVYPYINLGGTNAIIPGESGSNSFATGFDFSTGLEGNISRILDHYNPNINDTSPVNVGLYLEYQLQWFVAGLNPTGIFGGAPFILSQIVFGLDILPVSQ